MKGLHLISIIAGVMLLGCSGDSPEKQLASAKEYLQKKDGKAAVIQIKNVLQQQPASGEARYLLGMVLLQQGDAAGAEVELRKALAAQFAKDEVLPELARAMLMLGQAKKLVDEFSAVQLSKPVAQASLQTSLAAAYAALDRRREAQAALDAALAADKSYVPAQLLDARRRAGARDIDGALATIDAVVQADPKNAQAWGLRGDLLLYGRADSDGAIEAYKNAVAAAPDSFQARYALAAQLMRKGQLDEAGLQIDQMAKLSPKHPTTQFMQASLALQRKDFKTARELSQQLVQRAPKDPRVLQLAGAAELQGGSPVQAEIYLSRATQIAPNAVLARRLLVSSYMRVGQPAKALTVLNAMDEQRDFDANMYALAGEVYLQNGDAKRAGEAFAKSSKLDPNDARKRTALAVTHLASGRTDAGLDELHDIAGSDAGVTADMALISAYLRRQEFTKALAAVDVLEKKQPDKPLAANLRGRIQVMQKDSLGARKSFERALTIDPGFFPAAASLAALDLADQRPEEAKKRFEAMLARDPKNLQALLALAQVAAADQTARDQELAWLKKAVEAAPANPTPRLLLAEAYLRVGDPKQALAAAQAAVVAIPDNPDLLIALGRVLQVSGDVNQAMGMYSKAVAAQPLSPIPLVRLSELQMVTNDYKAAERSLRKALEMKADFLDAQRGLIAVLLTDRSFKSAVEVARNVQQQRPKEAVGLVLEGDIAAAQKDWPQALSAYKRALEVQKAPAVAVKIHSSALAAGNSKEADQIARSWSTANPKDVVFPLYLSERAINRKDYSTAEQQLKGVLQLQPDNAVALNNLAWVSYQLKKDGALEYAQRATTIAPGQPAFLDTLALILSSRGEHSRAIEMETKALSTQPDNEMLRLSLAKIYIAAGDKTKAKAELDRLEKLGTKFAAQAEVRELKGSL